MPVLRYPPLQAITFNAALLLLLLCLTVTWVQVEWSFRPESPGSPMDIAGLVLGHMLAFAALYASQIFVPGSRSRWLMTGMAILCYFLATAEYFLAAGLIDIPIAFLWMAAGIFLLFSQRIGMASAGIWFHIAIGISAAELIRNLIGAYLYGRQIELPPLFPWIDAGSDLLICSFYLLGFVDLLVGTGHRESPPRGEPLPALGSTSSAIGGSERTVRELLAFANTVSLAHGAAVSRQARAMPRPLKEGLSDAGFSSAPETYGWEVRLIVRDDDNSVVREEFFDVAIGSSLEAVEAVRRMARVSGAAGAEITAVAAIPADVFHVLGLSPGEVKLQ